MHLIRAVRLSHECMGQSFTLHRSHGPEQRRFRACALHQPAGYRERPPALQSPCSCPSTSPPRLIRSKVSVRDLRRAPARCSIRPVHRSKLQVAVCSRANASHGLFATSRRAVWQDASEHITRFTQYKTSCRAPNTHLYRAVRLSHERVGQSFSSIRAHGPKQWLPGSRLASCSVRRRTTPPDECCN